MYGYFKKDNSLYKVYQPKSSDYKFIKVSEYIQGYEQLTFTKKYLVICSSLKDIMAFTKLKYSNIEVIAPDSENTIISDNLIKLLKERYQAVCTLFDNDEAGIKAMTAYTEKYGIKGALLPLAKDLSDSTRDFGLLKTKEVLTPILKQALHV